MTDALDYDEIAARIHGYYLEANPGNDYAEFNKLAEYMKADNREAAMRIGKVLSMAGLRLEPRDGADWLEADQEIVRQVIEENKDLLAEAEHDGWLDARLRHGWKLAERKNTSCRESHLLVPYDDFRAQIFRKQEAVGPEIHREGQQAGKPMTLDEEVTWEKDKDVKSVRKFVDIIARTKYRIVVES
jgi:hypothetical protein